MEMEWELARLRADNRTAGFGEVGWLGQLVENQPRPRMQNQRGRKTYR